MAEVAVRRNRSQISRVCEAEITGSSMMLFWEYKTRKQRAQTLFIVSDAKRRTQPLRSSINDTFYTA